MKYKIRNPLLKKVSSLFQISIMVHNRLVKSQLLKKLVQLKKTHNCPMQPNIHPAVLYVEDVLNKDNLSWDHPQRRGFNLNNTIKTAIRSWPEMDPLVKGVFDKEAERLAVEHEDKEQEWFEKHGDMDYATEIRDIEKQLEKL